VDSRQAFGDESMGRPAKNFEPTYLAMARSLYLAVPEPQRLARSFDDLTPQARAKWLEIARHYLACGELPPAAANLTDSQDTRGREA
jgi:hypothetical protein